MSGKHLPESAKKFAVIGSAAALSIVIWQAVVTIEPDFEDIGGINKLWANVLAGLIGVLVGAAAWDVGRCTGLSLYDCHSDRNAVSALQESLEFPLNPSDIDSANRYCCCKY
jgi:hypothetical protein